MTDSCNSKQLLDNLNLIFAPENISESKILSLLNENLEVSTKDLLAFGEIPKITQDVKDKTALLNLLGYWLPCQNKEGWVNLVINEKLTVFSLVNIPFNYTSNDILENLTIFKQHNISSATLGPITRIYKKSLFWVLVVEDNLFAEELENYLIKAELKDDNAQIKIKYERVNAEAIKKEINKKISNHIYNKDISDLKLNGKDNVNADPNQKLSWRKKSNDTTENAYTSVNSRKDSKYGNIQKNSGFQRSSNAGGVVRDRYNSDGGHNSAYKPVKKYEEIEIDLSKISYSLKIKNKYSNGDLLLYYDKFRILKVFDVVPKFELFIEEICKNEKRKEFNFLKRERSMTYSLPLTYKSNKFEEVKLNLDAPAFKLPVQNPLSMGKLTGIQLNK